MWNKYNCFATQIEHIDNSLCGRSSSKYKMSNQVYISWWETAFICMIYFHCITPLQDSIFFVNRWTYICKWTRLELVHKKTSVVTSNDYVAKIVHFAKKLFKDFYLTKKASSSFICFTWTVLQSFLNNSSWAAKCIFNIFHSSFRCLCMHSVHWVVCSCTNFRISGSWLTSFLQIM